MAVSIFDLFKIGIGPSSSHTVGPMKAACTFARRLERMGLLRETRRVRISLYGSLAHTGRGHGTDKAVMLGLQGELPDSVDPDLIDSMLENIASNNSVALLGQHDIPFRKRRTCCSGNASCCPITQTVCASKRSPDGTVLQSREYYSVGGGFVVNQDEAAEDRIVKDETRLPYPFESADDLLTVPRKTIELRRDHAGQRTHMAL